MEPKKHEPHVFSEVDLMPFDMPFAGKSAGLFTPPPTPGGHSRVCGVCGAPKADRVHIEGELEADAESPKWG